MRNRWVILAILTMARLAMGFQFQTIGSTAPFLIDELNIDYATVGFLIGLYLLPGVGLAFPGGLLGQRFGDKNVVVVGLALMAIGGAGAGLGDSYSHVVAGRIVSGIGAVLLNVLLTKMLTDWFADRELVLAMSILVNSWPFGIGLALISLGPLADYSSWQIAFHVTAAFAILSLLPVAIWYDQPDKAGDRTAAAANVGRLSSREIILSSIAGSIWAFYNVAFAILLGFTPTFLIENNFTSVQAGFMLGLCTWLFVASVLAGGLIGQKFGRLNEIMVVGFLGFVIGLLLLPGSTFPLITLIIMGLLTGAPAGAIMSLPAEFLKPENRAAGFGIFITWYYVGMAALPAIAGWLRDITGNPGSPFYFGSLVMLAGLIALFFLRSLQRSGQKMDTLH